MKKNDKGYYPFLLACNKNNIEMIHLLKDYADKNNIILELNEKDQYGNYHNKNNYNNNNNNI